MDGNNTQQGGNQKPALSWSQPAASGGSGQKNNHPPRTDPTSGGGMGKTAGIVIGAIVVIGLVIWAIAALRSGSSRSGATASSTPEAAMGKTAGTQAQEPAASASAAPFTVPSPQSSGMEVAVADISVAAPTWVVIYENHNGTPGNALGAGLFFPASKSGTIELLRGTLPGQTYFAGESRDDGDRIFSLANDPALRDASGNPVLVQFQTK